METVLVTGAAGRIGTAFRDYAKDRYRLRLADRKVGDLPQGEFDVRQLNFAELDAVRAACEGVDVVLHLAADPSPRADFYESLLDNNIKSTYNIFRAAREAGCRRVVFASSVHAIGAAPLDVQAHEDSLPRPNDMYGVTKVFGEATGSYFASQEGLSNIAVRIGGFEGNRPNRAEMPNARNLSVFVSVRDLCQLFVCCIEAEDVEFAIVHGVSDNRFKRMAIEQTKALVGYRPQDDSFEKFGVGLVHSERWEKERAATAGG